MRRLCESGATIRPITPARSPPFPPCWVSYERGETLELTHDYIHPTPHGGRCRVRIYEDTTELPIIVCTELTDNPGMSITNAAEQIAAEVLENHPHVFDPFARASIAASPTTSLSCE